jgi:secondary thiamine-phosphate synthase enzyme
MNMHPSLTTHTVHTSTRTQMLDVTDLVRRVVREQRLVDGMAIVYVPHTTAAVTINENADPDVQHDLLLKLNDLIPKNESGYRHSEGNSDSHVKASLVGNSVIVLVERGRLILGQWQGIFFCEFDGPRQRQLLVRLVDFNAASRTAGSS